MAKEARNCLKLADVVYQFDSALHHTGESILKPLFDEVDEYLLKRKQNKRRNRVKVSPKLIPIDELSIINFGDFPSKAFKSILHDSQRGHGSKEEKSLSHSECTSSDVVSSFIIDEPNTGETALKRTGSKHGEQCDQLLELEAEKRVDKSTGDPAANTCKKQLLSDEIDIFNSVSNSKTLNSEPKIKRTKNRKRTKNKDNFEPVDPEPSHPVKKCSKMSISIQQKYSESPILATPPSQPEVNQKPNLKRSETIPPHCDSLPVEDSKPVSVLKRQNNLSIDKNNPCNIVAQIDVENNVNTPTLEGEIDILSKVKHQESQINRRNYDKAVLSPVLNVAAVEMGDVISKNIITTVVHKVGSGQSDEVRVTRTRAKQIEKERKEAEAARLLEEKKNKISVLSTFNATTKKTSMQLDKKRRVLLSNFNTPFSTTRKVNTVHKPLPTPFKIDKEIGKIQKENIAFLKKEEMKKLTSQQVRTKRETKMQKANEKKLAAEREKAETMRRLQKEKDEREKALKAEREKQKEEMVLKKKQIADMKLKEAEERRLKDEAARLAKLKQQEEEQTRLAALRLKQEKEAAQLLLQQLADEQKRKALEATYAKQTFSQAVPSTTASVPSSDATTAIVSVNISDIDSNLDDDDDQPQIKKKKKHIIPRWSENQFIKAECEDQAFISRDVLMFMLIDANPSSRELFNESVVSSRHQMRTSSLYWTSP